MFTLQTIIELKNGNPSAYKEVFHVLYPRLKGYCRLFISDVNQVEDIIQESFISFWENRNCIKTDQSIQSYVFVILRNKCLNFLKQRKLERHKIDIDNVSIAELQFLFELDFIQKEETSLEEQLVNSLRKAVDELPEKMRDVFILCKIEGYKQKDVAEKLNISLKMVEKHIMKAKQIICKKLTV